MSGPTVARLVDHRTGSQRVVLVARLLADVPEGAYVALVDVAGQLFLKVVEDDDPQFLSAKQIHERIKK